MFSAKTPFVLLLFIGFLQAELPETFVYLTDVDPTIIESVRYATDENFLGRPVPGYEGDRIICTYQAAKQLKKVNKYLKAKGYKLVVYDAYRPQRSVDAFIEWSVDLGDQIAKQYYYPTVDKKDIFDLGFLAQPSSHTRGSAFDVTIIKIDKNLEPIVYEERYLLNGEKIYFLNDGTVDMGVSFDLFHEASHHNSNLVSKRCTRMRNFLKNVMEMYGFKAYRKEWWHYTLCGEPYPDTYFNFVVE